MPNRILKESICTSENLNILSADEERFFYRLIVNCDDFGRFDGRAVILRTRLYPLKIDKIKEYQIDRWLESLVDADLIMIYHSNNLPYIQVKKWENHQQVRATKSKYPEPSLISSDINCNQMISNDINCSRNRNRNRNNVIVNGHFDLFWQAYPKKKSKGDAEKAFKKLNPDEDLLNVILSKIEKLRVSPDWTKEDGQYIPNPAKWINAKGWEDEVKVDVKPVEKPYTGR